MINGSWAAASVAMTKRQRQQMMMKLDERSDRRRQNIGDSPHIRDIAESLTRIRARNQSISRFVGRSTVHDRGPVCRQ